MNASVDHTNVVDAQKTTPDPGLGADLLAVGRQQTWDATGAARIVLLLAGIDRKWELQRLYDEADDPALKLTLPPR
jgi:hypothetical protein